MFKCGWNNACSVWTWTGLFDWTFFHYSSQTALECWGWKVNLRRGGGWTRQVSKNIKRTFHFCSHFIFFFLFLHEPFSSNVSTTLDNVCIPRFWPFCFSFNVLNHLFPFDWALNWWAKQNWFTQYGSICSKAKAHDFSMEKLYLVGNFLALYRTIMIISRKEYILNWLLICYWNICICIIPFDVWLFPWKCIVVGWDMI